ncbi:MULTISPECIES: hypothetical protein [Oceanobacillus]|uniref:Uncharacterized protein n=1 Tax=Oceanobacillus kimchii TaxID=746691 RepID=A0ABQ5TS39_9BACI|nr:hypothetical protein [Oceanobacillus kimchii]GLO68260.1 hypothetical protein MACH08_40440 [Oceanobacillus kimchii]
MIKLIREYDGKWMVYNTQNSKVADILTINEYNYYPQTKTRYRVDYKGETQKSMIEHFSTAKSIAWKIVK